MAFQVRMKIGLRLHVAILVISLLLTKTSFVSSIPTQELDAMLSVVRAQGYNLFSNAITTSDLHLDLLTAAPNASFTFFAPTDSSLFALAMTQSAFTYTATLRYHCLPRRLSLSDLNRFPSQVIQTLLPSQYVSLTRRLRGSSSDAIFVNGINIVLPGLYYSRHVAVHGLEGILSLHSQIQFPYYSLPPLPPFRPSAPSSFPPEENRDFTGPAADPSIGISSVFPPISPSNSLNKTIDLPFNHIFLGPSPGRSNFQFEPPVMSSVSPSTSPIHPPAVSNEVTPSMPSMSTSAAWMTKPEDGLSGETVEEYEPLNWTPFGFTEENSKNIDVEDSHPRPNVAASLN
ncbi:uncharacterized protein LOC103491315 [Cucumis melo]|uniref:Uncharacterized protein LOC103491315 n=1 Tax=Cucumis melo TaxID=3656 RepID=A0A1S3BM06_CUCME|nr:uncharacterized protein LOC103491315 [Cucumis melo]